MKTENFAIKTVRKKLEKCERMFLLCQTSLTKCIEDQKHFKAAKDNIPFYRKLVIDYDKKRKQLDRALTILRLQL